MALRAHISERQRRFGIELRRLRLGAGVSVQDAAAHINLRGPHLNHIEAARTGLDETRLRSLAALYGCTDATQLNTLTALGASDGKGWWSSYRKNVPAFSLDLAELESANLSRYLNYETFFIPGLLQTEEYIRCLFESNGTSLSPDQVEGSIRFRLNRQSILTNSPSTRFSFVIHEAALPMTFAGKEAMHRQLEHLLRLWEIPNVDIQIFPFSIQATPPFSGPFMITEPAAPALSTLVNDHPGAAGFIDVPHVVQQYTDRFADLSRLALRSGNAKVSARPESTRDSWTVVQHAKHGFEEEKQSAPALEASPKHRLHS